MNNSAKKQRNNNTLNVGGFTLVELVIVIILMGIVAVGVSGFLRIGTQIYVDSTNRDEIIASGRFAVERINRELRAALPNSLRISNNGASNTHCIEYTPIITSTSYLDIPVSPEVARKEISVIEFNDTLIGESPTVSVYALTSGDVYSSNGKVMTLSDVKIDESLAPQWQLSFSNDVLFSHDSPTLRLFFIDSPVSYCIKQNELRRFVGGNPNMNGGISFSSGALMAESVDSSSYFQANSSTQNRNATALFQLTFTRLDESVSFNHEVQVPNVP